VTHDSVVAVEWNRPGPATGLSLLSSLQLAGNVRAPTDAAGQGACSGGMGWHHSDTAGPGERTTRSSKARRRSSGWSSRGPYRACGWS